MEYRMWSGSNAWVQDTSLPFTGCVTLGRLLNPSGPTSSSINEKNPFHGIAVRIIWDNACQALWTVSRHLIQNKNFTVTAIIVIIIRGQQSFSVKVQAIHSLGATYGFLSCSFSVFFCFVLAILSKCKSHSLLTGHTKLGRRLDLAHRLHCFDYDY